MYKINLISLESSLSLKLLYAALISGIAFFSLQSFNTYRFTFIFVLSAVKYFKGVDLNLLSASAKVFPDVQKKNVRCYVWRPYLDDDDKIV